MLRDLFAETVTAARRKGIVVADPTPPADRSCNVNGLNLHFLDWETTDKKSPMLLLHGALLQSHVWDFFSLDMRATFQIPRPGPARARRQRLGL